MRRVPCWIDKFRIDTVAIRDVMTKDEVRSKLKSIFETVLDVDDLDLRDDLSAGDVEEWDSLSHVRLIVTVERQFKIKFSNAEIEELKNVGDLIRLVMTKVG
jgi:acyl carrier protein